MYQNLLFTFIILTLSRFGLEAQEKSYVYHQLTTETNPLELIENTLESSSDTGTPTLMGYFGANTEDCFTIYVDMVGDLFHCGHQNVLRQAYNVGKELAGDRPIYMIAGLCSDEECTPYKRLPINTLAERTAAAIGSRWVDAVLFPAPLAVTREMMDNYHIDLVVHGDDFDKEKLHKYYGVAIECNKFRAVPYTKGVSTSAIIERVKSRN